MKLKSSILLFTIFLSSLPMVDNYAQEKNTNSFTEVFKEFPRQEKNLRKWDAPVIADLDQDGYQDLLINDHGFGVQVCWNNKGIFAKPFDIIMGDIHGVSVGDIDQDGILEVIMSRGGGSGSNARNSKIFSVSKQRKFSSLPDFEVPLALMRGRTVKFMDGDNDGDLDLLNFAFPDASKKGESENYIYKNDGNGELILNSDLPAIKIDGQKTLITDFNGDNVFDIILYGNDKVKAYKGKGDLTYLDVSDEVFPHDLKEITSINEIDYDNDGDFDLYFTRGKPFEIGETFFDQESKIFGFYTKRGDFKFEDLEVGDVINLENFQSQWPNNDTYFIGESAYDYEFQGETHSGKNIRLVNSDALGFPDNTNYKDKRGWYIGYVGNKKWRLSGFLWAPATGIVQGVKSYPSYDHHKGLNDILLRNNGGKFEDVTKESKLFLEEHSEGATIADLDNNNFADILVVRRGNLIHENESIVYMNQGNSTFKRIKEHGLLSTELGAIGMAVEAFDYNKDGKMDVVIGNERGKWHLFKNEMLEAGKNKYITIEVGTSKSGKSTALGALVTVESCGVKQMQKVGNTGSPYSLNLNTAIHFGLGTCTKSLKVKVTWTNGEVLKQTIKSVNDIISIGNKP